MRRSIKNSALKNTTKKSDLLEVFREAFPKEELPTLQIDSIEDNPGVFLIRGNKDKKRHIIYGRIILNPKEMKEWGITDQ